MYSEETKSSSLAKFLSIYDYVFVDTCSLMEDSFPVFMDNLTASHEYWRDGLHVIVLGECVEELKKHAASKDNQEARIEAKRALKILHHDKWFHKILEVTKSNTNYGFADNAIYTAVSSLRIQNKVLIITQDKMLATDLKKLNSLDSQRGRYVLVYRLNQQGDLEENPGETGLYQGRTYSSAPRSSSNPNDHHGRGGLFHRAPRAEKPVEPVEEKPVPDSPIVSADKRLMANLNNPNYPADKKLADIDEQLAAISALAPADKDKLSLAYTYDELIQEKVKLAPKANEAAPVKATPAPHQTVSVTPKAETVMAPKAESVMAPKVVEAPKPVAPAPAPTARPQRLWFEFGSSVQEALTRTGVHYGIIFRDASVPYFPAIHGPYDLTRQDLDVLAKQVGVLKTGEKKDLPLGTLIAHIEKTERDYKATLEIPAKVAPISANPAPSVEAKAEAQPTPEPVKSVNKSAKAPVAKAPAKKAAAPLKAPEVKPVEAKPDEDKKPRRRVAPAKAVKKENPAPANASKPSDVHAQDANTAVPSGATLVVGVPTNVEKKGYIERRIRREDQTELSAVPNPDKGKRPARAQKAPKVTSKGTKPIAQDVPEADVAAIVKEDKNLNAKVNNPNYPVNQKINDLLAQKGKLKRLKAAEQKDLMWPASKIDAKVSELKGLDQK
jgi:rRNA-processing protein FCF1